MSRIRNRTWICFGALSRAAERLLRSFRGIIRRSLSCFANAIALSRGWRATLIVEAGLPSGTFSTADEALGANKDVLAVPGSIFSATSAGSNMLLAQGAMPIVSKEVFDSAIM